MNQSSKLRIAHMMFLILLLAAGSLLQSGQRIMAENVKDTIGGTCVLSSDDAEQFPQDLTNATNFSIENVGFNTQKNEKVQSSFITKKTELSRITSYNVCYTKLLRFHCSNGTKAHNVFTPCTTLLLRQNPKILHF